MTNDPITIDQNKMQHWLARNNSHDFNPHFQPSAGIQKLSLKVNIEAMRSAFAEIAGDLKDLGDGFSAINLTRRPGVQEPTPYDLSGLFWTRVDDSYQEVQREENVDEFLFTEFNPAYQGSYFEEVYKQLTARFPIGRMRILGKTPYNCNSWHRDPEPRIHIPIISNPGSLFIVNHHVTHLPADGSVYFTDTRGYHAALNGGESQRVHLVAALPWREESA